jgi:hypothetical protein
MTRLPCVTGLLAAAVLLGLAGGGCSRTPRDPDYPVTAAARHHEADQHLDSGDVPGARQLLLSLLGNQAEGAPPSEVRRLIIQDTYFRLARLSLGEHDVGQALTYADAGLAAGADANLFVANLYVVRGAAHEARGDSPAAAADYHRALAMNEALLREVMPAP